MSLHTHHPMVGSSDKWFLTRRALRILPAPEGSLSINQLELGGTTCLTRLVYYGLVRFLGDITCLTWLPAFATLFATFEDNVRETSSVRQ